MEVVESDPQDHDLGFSMWTLPSLQAFMERETGIHLSQNRISEVLKDVGYVYRRPKKDLGYHQDLDLREQVQRALDEVKKTHEKSISGFSNMDESGFSLNYPLTKCWMRANDQKRLPASTQPRSGCSFAGVIDWMSEWVWYQPIERLNTECLIRYFEWLFLEIYPDEPLVLVIDNAPSHRSTAMQAFLSLFEHRIVVIWLPPYSPDMNLIEPFGKHLKQQVAVNRLFSDVARMLPALQTELVHQNCTDYQYHRQLSGGSIRWVSVDGTETC